MSRQKIVLAYSGGLDTSVLVRILSDDYGYDVVACHADVGEAKDREKLAQKARQAGAVACEIVDAKDEFAREFCFPALQANALYQGVYPLSAALSRPLIARHLVAEARKHGASAVAHGATGKGNDQVRFDLAVKGLAPELKIIAPQRERNITRDAAMEYAAKHGIEVPTSKKSPFSIDENLWGRSIEGGKLEDPDAEPPEEAFAWTRSWKDAPEKPAYLKIGFEKGLPVSVDGRRLDPAELIARVGKVAGENGVGRIDLMEDRVVGIKSRETYECPAAVALIAAHQDLERFTTLRQSLQVKQFLDQKFAETLKRCEAEITRAVEAVKERELRAQLEKQARRRMVKVRAEAREEVDATLVQHLAETQQDLGAAEPAQEPVTPERLVPGVRVRVRGFGPPVVLRRLVPPAPSKAEGSAAEGRNAGSAEVEAGPLRMKVPLDDITAIVTDQAAQPKGADRAAAGSVTVHAQPPEEPVGDEINVIGCTVEEATRRVDKFLDQAALAGKPRVRIIHGHGTGALRRGLAEFLSSHPLVEKLYAEEADRGGAAITVVELRGSA